MSFPIVDLYPRPLGHRGVIRARDIVTTGCGRVYVFPEDLPQVRRLAGFGHPDHRVGYVEAVAGVWLPRDIGNRPVRHATGIRSLAIQSVVEHAGWSVQNPLEHSHPVPTGVRVSTAAAPGTIYAEVFLSGDGQVLLGPPSRGNVGPSRILHMLGIIWRSGDEVGALSTGRESTHRTLHRSHSGAIYALVKASGYRRAMPERS